MSVSTNGGGTWSDVERTTSSLLAWTLVDAELGTLTDQMQFRFVAEDAGSGSIVEAGVDDFSIVTYQDPPTGVVTPGLAAAERVTLLQNAPNPSRPGTTIRFAVPQPGRPVTLRVYDIAGRVVATLLDDELVAGVREVRWHGRTDDGGPAASGIYFYRLDAGEESLSRKLVLLR